MDNKLHSASEIQPTYTSCFPGKGTTIVLYRGELQMVGEFLSDV